MEGGDERDASGEIDAGLETDGSIPQPDAGGSDSGTPTGRCADLTVAKGFVCIEGVVQPGTFASVANIFVSVLGQPSGRVETTDAGAFALLLDTRLNPVATKGPSSNVGSVARPGETYQLILQTPDQLFGSAISLPALPTAPNTMEIEAVELRETRSISGSILLPNATDHSGTRVEITGTPYFAMTDANGDYNIPNVPLGRYPRMRAAHEGYHDQLLGAHVHTIFSAMNTATMLLDQGNVGGFEFTNAVHDDLGTYVVGEFFLLNVFPPADAQLMMLAWSETFEGAVWEDARNEAALFREGGGNFTLYLKFINSAGVETTPVSESLFADIDPQVSILSPLGPTTPTTTPTFDWADARAPWLTYHLQISNGTNINEIRHEAKGLAASNYTVPSSILRDGSTYYARVAVVWGGDRFSWSVPVQFRVAIPPTPDVLVTPHALSQTSDSSPTLTWESNGPVGTTYVVQVSRTANFTQLVAQASGLTSASYTVDPPLAQTGTYYVRIAGINLANMQGPWSEPFAMVFQHVTPDPGNATELLQALCDWEFRCCSTRERSFRLGDASNAVECVAALTAQLGDTDLDYTPATTGAIAVFERYLTGLNTAYVTLNPAGVQACIEKWNNEACGVEPPLNPGATCKAPGVDPCSMRSMFSPALTEGEVCNIVLTEGDTDLKEHSVGNDIECVAGTTCVGTLDSNNNPVNVCAKRGELGDSCSAQEPCDYNLYCDSGSSTCVSKAALGASCTVSSSRCQAGLFCNPNTLKCDRACQDGSPCPDQDGRYPGCPADLRCLASGPNANDASCRKPTLNGACRDSLSCLPSQICSLGSVCAPLKGPGTPCVSEYECDKSQGLGCRLTNDGGEWCIAWQADNSACDTSLNYCPPWAPCQVNGFGPYGLCTANSACVSDATCPESKVCHVETGGSFKVCSDGAPLGSACDNAPNNAALPSCARGLVCPFGTCVAPLEPGANCEGAAGPNPCRNQACVTAWSTKQCSDKPTLNHMGHWSALICDGQN